MDIQKKNLFPHSYDARLGDFHSGSGWADPHVLGSRASFNTHSDPPKLVVKQVLARDQGVYTCRIDYILSPSTTALINLTVAGKMPQNKSDPFILLLPKARQYFLCC